MAELNEKNLPLRLSGSTVFLCLMLGILLSLPFKLLHKESAEPTPSDSRQELLNRVLKITEENDQLRIEITQLRGKNTELLENQTHREEATTQLAETRKNYRTLAGMDAVHGPGIKLTLTENPPEVPPGGETAPYVIHQEDLLNIINELWLAGTEAMAVSSRGHTERMIVKSTVRCVGSMIDVNNTRMAPPFEIFAIGNSDNLESALTMPGGVLRPLDYFNIKAQIDKMPDIQLPAYSGSTLMQYAKPVEE
jgi:uncharacterized protein YlxW (UPF0749 family)